MNLIWQWLVTAWDWLWELEDKSEFHAGSLTLKTPWPVWVAILASIVVIVAVIMIYRRDGGTKPGKAIGAALRCVLLVLLLVLIWQPVIRVEKTVHVPGLVAVLVDTSRSMTTTDPYGDDDPAVIDLGKKIAAAKPRPDDPDGTRRALDMLKSSRIDTIRELLSYENLQALHALLANNDVAIYTFSDKEPSADKEALPPLRLRQETGKWVESKNADGAVVRNWVVDDPEIFRANEAKLRERLAAFKPPLAVGKDTDVPRAVTGVLKAQLGQELAGVIVISDGRSTLPQSKDKDKDPVKLAGEAQVPIHVVTVGSIHPPKRIEAAELDAPDVVFPTEMVPVKVTIRQDGVTRPELVRVKVAIRKSKRPKLGAADEPAPAAASQPADWEAKALDERYEPEKEVARLDDLRIDGKTVAEPELRFKPTAEGEFLIVATVEPLGPASQPDARPTTTQPDVRKVSQPILVRDDRVRVLLADNIPRWEYRYASHSLVRDKKSVELGSFLFSADSDFLHEGSLIQPNPPGMSPLLWVPLSIRSHPRLRVALKAFPTKMEDDWKYNPNADPDVSDLDAMISDAAERERMKPRVKEWRKWDWSPGWKRFDVVILGDISPVDHLGLKQMGNIGEFVKVWAGGFAMISGEQYAPNSYAPYLAISELLPIRIDPNAGYVREVRPDGF